MKSDSSISTMSLSERRRQRARVAVISAARKLLAQGDGERFTMRDLAAEAGLSLATPYNHFGSKRGVLRAVVDEANAGIKARFENHPTSDDPLDRVLSMAEIGADFLLADRDVIRPAAQALTIEPGDTSEPTLRDEASALWSLAIQADFPFRAEAKDLGAVELARQLAVMFRGSMSFWISGEVDDSGFRSGVVSGAATVILAFADPARIGRTAEWLLTPSVVSAKEVTR